LEGKFGLEGERYELRRPSLGFFGLEIRKKTRRSTRDVTIEKSANGAST